MERHDESDVIDLGEASAETQGQFMGEIEPAGRTFTGLAED
ncbi:MAG TPA: benenodin family lasso peptide [Caulobacter sp.]|nr:benenodin family lasso peptide [Caulobacter sp.]